MDGLRAAYSWVQCCKNNGSALMTACIIVYGVYCLDGLLDRFRSAPLLLCFRQEDSPRGCVENSRFARCEELTIRISNQSYNRFWDLILLKFNSSIKTVLSCRKHCCVCRRGLPVNVNIRWHKNYMYLLGFSYLLLLVRDECVDVCCSAEAWWQTWQHLVPMSSRQRLHSTMDLPRWTVGVQSWVLLDLRCWVGCMPE